MTRKWIVLSLAMFVSTSVLAEASEKLTPKLRYAESTIFKSPTAKRFNEVGTEEAKQALKKAQDLLEQAIIAHRNGIPKQANALAGLALRKFTEAAKLLPASESAQKVMRTRYAELSEEITSYLEWYDSAEYVSGDEKSTIGEVKSEMVDAKDLYNNKSYKKANSILARVLDKVVNMSNRSMTSSEVVMSLDFATPEEEYKYEIGKNNEYKRLVPIALDQKKPSGGRLMLFKRFIKKAEGIRATADSEHESQGAEAAIKSLQNSTDQYKKALSMIGVR